MIAALAGRRIDAPNAAPERFPHRSIPEVSDRVDAAFRAYGVTTLVCAAACGADLIALQVAEARRIRRYIILPTAPAAFRASSVVDRPGNWGALFDRFIADAETNGNLDVLPAAPASSRRYLDANAAILERALALGGAAGEGVTAFAIWDGPLTGHTDYTEAFVLDAQRRGLAVTSLGIVAKTP